MTDLVHQSVMYYQDRLEGGGIHRTVLAVRTSGDSEGYERMTAMLKERLDNSIEVVTPGLGAGGNGTGVPALNCRPGRADRPIAAGRWRGGVTSMLRTNLSTRPFYNERAVHLAGLVVGLVAVMIMAIGVARLARLGQDDRRLTALAERDEAAAADMSAQAGDVRRGTNEADLEALAISAREANQLIDQRVFSWTAFFNRIEETLPASVMLASVRPDVDAEGLAVLLGVVGREMDEIDAFIEALEATGAFADVLAREQEMTDEGTYRALLVGRYLSTPRESTVAAEEAVR